MAETGSVKVTIDDAKIKERMREFLAKAWDEGYRAVHTNAMRPLTNEPPIQNPYRQ